jgi:hypothetical protein
MRQVGMGMGTGVDGAGDAVMQVFGLARSTLDADASDLSAFFPDVKRKAGRLLSKVD